MFIKKFQKKSVMNNVIAIKTKKKNNNILSAHTGGRVSKSAPPPQIAAVSKNSLAGYFGKSILWYL